MPRPETLTAEEEVVDRLYAWVFLRYGKWPVTKAEMWPPDDYLLVPLMPRLQAWHEQLHGDEVREFRQVTAEERELIRKGRYPLVSAARELEDQLEETPPNVTKWPWPFGGKRDR